MGKMEDLKEAILVAWQVVDIMPKDYLDLVGWLNNLRIKFSHWYKYIKKMEDLEEAILMAR